MSYNFYIEHKDGVWHMTQTYGYTGNGWLPTIMRNARRVWQVGPRGGVRVIKQQDFWQFPPPSSSTLGYVTKNPNLMKEFSWIKLCAKTIQTGV